MPTPAIAANAYAALAQLRDQSAGLSRDAAAPEGGLNFGSVLKDVVTNVTAIGRKSDAQVQAVAMGEANMIDVVTAVAESETAIRTMVAVRDKVIAAYEEMHHLVIAALNDSYTLFEPGELPTSGDAAALITKTVAGAFRIGIQLSAPFIVFGLLFNIGLGILARLMPQMQVFFVGLPLSILIGFLFLLLLLGAMMSFFLDYAGGVLHALTPHG